MSERYAVVLRFSSRLLASGSLAWCAYAAWVLRPFSELTPLGPLPLIVPLLTAAAAFLAAWTNRPIALSVGALVMLAYAFVTGFSIGGMYQPVGGALALSAALLWAGQLSRSTPP
jgi:hypothetical protein